MFKKILVSRRQSRLYNRISHLGRRGWNHSVSHDDRTQNKIHLNDFVNSDHKDFLLNWVLSTKIYFPVPYNGVEMEKVPIRTWKEKKINRMILEWTLIWTMWWNELTVSVVQTEMVQILEKCWVNSKLNWESLAPTRYGFIARTKTKKNMKSKSLFYELFKKTFFISWNGKIISIVFDIE